MADLFDLEDYEPTGKDFCGKDGAEALKAKIEAYWAARGHYVQIRVENKGFHSSIRAARYDLRSDMRNGMPRPIALAQDEAA